MTFLKRLLRSFPLLVLSPFLIAGAALMLVLTDLLWKLAGKKARASAPIPSPQPPVPNPRLPAPSSPPPAPGPRSASVVIPNWNGRDLLEKYLPSVIEALSGNPENEIIVVDNGSTDGSADFV